ncbi:MAG: hypothetical protein MPJ50_04980 [Pirellulales bacterium]|nr:hypothetical protein [Pirellulales bacterium]
MKGRLNRTAITFVLFALALPATAVHGQGIGTALEVRQALAELRGWLAGSGHGEGWNAHLGNETLARQLDLASNPATPVDVAALQDVLSRYSTGSRELELRRFVAVREKLAAWIHELNQPGIDQLPEMLRTAAGDFAEPDEASLADAKAQVNAASQPLRRFLNGSHGAAWSSYLNWEALDVELSAALPDVEILNNSADQFESGYAGLELPMFAKTAAALRRYTQLCLVHQDPNAQAEYQTRMNALADAIDAFAGTQNRTSLQVVSDHVTWLESRGLASELTAKVRERLWRPNLIIQIAPQFATAGFHESVHEISDVTDVILGTDIRGKARTIGDVHARLLPGENKAVFENVFVGTTYSRTLGYNRGIVISTEGTTKFTATKQFSFDQYGFTGYSSKAQATTYSDTNWIDVGKKHPLIRRLVERVAERKVHQSRPEADAIAGQHAEDRIEEQMDLNADERLAQANKNYYEKFRKPLLDKGLFPQSFDTHSSVAGLLFVVRQYSDGGIAATTTPPDLATSDDITVSAHQSAINNMMSAMLAGRTINRDEFLVEIGELLGELPEQMEPPEDEPNWTIEFAAQDPVTVSVDGDLVTLVIRALSFHTQGREPNNDPLNITVRYRFLQQEGGFAAGDVVARREGDIEALPPDYQPGQILPSRIIAVIRRVRSNFAKFFGEELVSESRPLPDKWAQAGDMWLRNVKVTPGWLVFGWQAAPQPKPDVPLGTSTD